MNPSHRSRTVWIAILAICVLLRGLAMITPMSWSAQINDKLVVEICSASGSVQQINLGGRAPAKQEGSNLPHGKHCPWCALSHDNLMPQAATPKVSRLPMLVAGLSAWHQTPTRPALAWVSLPSRAPPLV